VGPLSNLHRKAKELLGLSPAAEADGPPGASSVAPATPHVPATPAPPGPLPHDPLPPAARPAADDAFHLRPARRAEVHGAVRSLMSLPGRLVDEAQVDEFVRTAPARRVDLSLLWVAERRGRVVWVLLPVLSPGRTALLLSPTVPPSAAERAAAGGLLDEVAAALAARGVDLAQALLDPTDVVARDLFAGRRFVAMAELIYLSAEPRRRPPAPPPLPDGLAWVAYGPRTHGLFKRAIAATYEDSLDCPALNGVRDMDDVVAGHQASGEFDPALWRLLCRPAVDPAAEPDPLGVLLLSRIPQARAVELVYLGVAPAARGRRLGDLLVRHALTAVVDQGMARLTLAVDARNAPALKVYYRNGMARAGAKLAVMRDLRDGAAGGAARGPRASSPV
jgi:mycothiol synthase